MRCIAYLYKHLNKYTFLNVYLSTWRIIIYGLLRTYNYVTKPTKIDHVSTNYTELYFC